MLGEGLASAAGEIGGAGNTASLVDRERGADRGDRLPGPVRVHTLHEARGQRRENTPTRYTAVARLHLIPRLGRKKLAKLTAKDVLT